MFEGLTYLVQPLKQSENPRTGATGNARVTHHA